MTLPAQILDLANWKITLPVGSKNKLTEVKQPKLAGYEHASYFHTSGDGVLFRAPVNGVTTSGSANPRSELREMNSDGSNASWSSTDGKTHTLIIDQAITHLPNARTDGGVAGVVAGQIHDANDDICVFRLEGTLLWLTNGDNTHFKLIDAHYALGERFQAAFVAHAGVVDVYYNGLLVGSIPVKFSGGYFKSGAYTQANSKNSKPNDVSNYGEVLVYGLTVVHGAAVPIPVPGTPPVDPPPTQEPPPVPAAQIVVIRHGEKSSDKSSHVLNATGLKRAQALVELFTRPNGPLPTPGCIYASKGDTVSMRPLQTVQPLAAKLGLTINTKYDAENAESAMGKELAKLTGVTLVCLEHTAIVGVCKALGTLNPKTPKSWPDANFWTAWVFTKTAKGWDFTQVPELILPGDKATPIK